jgi:DNA helicase-2/ATP-dependent DNA helicase PcrA
LRNDLENGMPLSDVVRHLLEKTGYLKHLVQEGSQQSLSRRDNVVELQNAISYYEHTNKNPKLANFLQEISLITDADKYDENRPMVTLMTVHASKGLEFPCVFIVGLEENLFPMGGRNGEEADLEEERRLMYVAITRAKETLFLSYAESRLKFGEIQRSIRSRFLDEVDAGVVVTETGATIHQKAADRFESGGSDSIYQIDRSTSQELDYGWKKPLEQKNKRFAAAENSHNPNDYAVGAQVMHPKFGPGKILNKSGQGKDVKVVVFFPKHGQKKLLLRFAKLQLLG